MLKKTIAADKQLSNSRTMRARQLKGIQLLKLHEQRGKQAEKMLKS